MNATNNKQRGDDSANIDMSARFGFANQEAAEARGYEFKNNPQVELFTDDDDFKLRLAINTAQYGRTFQDRCVLLVLADYIRRYFSWKCTNSRKPVLFLLSCATCSDLMRSRFGVDHTTWMRTP